MKDINNVEIKVGDKVYDMDVIDQQEPDIVLEVGSGWVLTTRRRVYLQYGQIPLAVDVEARGENSD